MHEIWLRTNHRALWFGTAVPLVVVAIGGWLMWQFASDVRSWLCWLGAVLIALGAALIVSILLQLRRPRIAYQDGQVLFYLRNGSPLAVPVQLVEAFFLGQGPLALPGAPQEGATVNLVARISQRDPSYAQRDVKRAFGAWCESYVTIRGTWCEPLNGELIRRLNRRLREATEGLEGSTGAG